ncbi:MAG: DJ-1/PfpI family protein [Treponema brennaborense]|nr:DJ-1/PfpI family protein [Prevotella sp.]MCM1408924.1 DJ-1/PfpI family protein [Treponema brennaborense]
MSQVLIFLAPGCEESEAIIVIDLLRRAGISVGIVSAAAEKYVTGSHGITVCADMLLADADFDAAQMLVLPGGVPGTPNLSECAVLTEKLREFAACGKYIAAVCAAPSILGRLGLLNGRTAVCYPGYEDTLAGAEISEKAVAVDGNIITSRGMGTCFEFAAAIIEVLAGKPAADTVLKQILAR